MTTNKKLQTVEMDPTVAESVRRVVQPEVDILPELSFQNIVTTGELDMLVASSQQIFKEQPVVKTKLATGAKVVVTKHSAPFEIDGRLHHIRLMRYRTLRRREDVYVIFDKTESPDQVVVQDPGVFRLESGDDVKKGVYVNVGNMVPELNERTHVSFAEWVLGEIVEAGDKQKAVEVRKAQDAAEKRERQKREQAWSKSGRWDQLGDHILEFSPFYALGGMLLTFSGTVIGVTAFEKDPIVEFDKKHYEIAGGAVAQIGSTAVNPEFSFELLHNENLDSHDVPVIGATDRELGPKVADGSDREHRTSLKELRQVQLNTGDSKKSCETTYVHFDNPTDGVRIWTDYQGDPKHIETTVGNDSVEVCWTGPELDDKEVPRVVVRQQLVVK